MRKFLIGISIIAALGIAFWTYSQTVSVKPAPQPAEFREEGISSEIQSEKPNGEISTH